MRQATKEDLEDLTTIAQAAFPDDPQWDYRFPYRDQYPKDNRNWTRRQYREYLDDPEKYLIMVITAPDAERPISGKPVALAVWNVSNLQRNATARITSKWPRYLGAYYLTLLLRALETFGRWRSCPTGRSSRAHEGFSRRHDRRDAQIL